MCVCGVVRTCGFITREEYRYSAVVLRARFEKNRNELDMRKAKELLRLGEDELFKGNHTHPIKFPESPGGVAYERYVQSPDWTLDYWHPAEKAAYPDYFARREARKTEYIEFWNKQYGGPDAGKKTDDHH
ncbi:unnamed protein product [Allacma fusca]|uniref:NADH dehydrogenase [ubiquinone] 1 beta subcomplex subunit 9 n=1 Tax=Allacma fusca TaxID=39272 RepID=A0A8J2NZH8_9HEXA|nr:unnamed protein product [Allacma fusca]